MVLGLNRRLVVLLMTVGSVGCGADSTSAPSDTDASIGSPDAAALVDAGPDAPENKPPLRVLFVGNSYTYVNDLPSVIHALGAATPGAAVDVDSVTVGGATLELLWENGDAPTRIASGDFDAVVVQGNSLEAFGTADFFYPYAHLFADAARDASAQVVWYATWARRAGDSFYGTGFYTPDTMTRSVDHAYRQAAEQWGGTVARAGAAWQLAGTEQPAVNLYADDGSHPSPAGTLLAACTIFLALTGKEAVLADPIPLGIDRPTATALCALAPRVRCGPEGCGCDQAAEVSTTYTALHGLSAACDGTAEQRGLDCNQAMNAMCAATPCMNAGFGHATVAGDGSVDLTCVPGTPLDTTFTALRALEPSCDGSTQRYGQGCATAVHRACAATGAVSGFGPTSVAGDTVKATCVQPASARLEHLQWIMLPAYDYACGTSQRWGADCDIAIDAFCRNQGFAGGFGPVEATDTDVDVVCVGW